jgi:hypothetical protein
LREPDYAVPTGQPGHATVSLEQGPCRTFQVRSRKGCLALLTTLASYGMISNNLTRSLSTTAAQPQVARESAYYLANIGNVKSIDDFLGNDRLFSFAMKAYGLDDMTYAKAFMRKVLTEGVDDSDSFANTLTDKRYADFATAFNFARYGDTTTVFDRTQQGTVDNYVRQTLETDAGAQGDGVRLALYFQRKASTIKDAYSILADPALLKVVQTTLGIPAGTSAMDIDKQAQMISGKVDVTDFQDATKLSKFVTRFATMWGVDNPSTDTSSTTVLFAQPIETGIGMDLLSSLQNLKLGG